jgi:hypothetical protein
MGCARSASPAHRTAPACRRRNFPPRPRPSRRFADVAGSNSSSMPEMISRKCRRWVCESLHGDFRADPLHCLNSRQVSPDGVKCASCGGYFPSGTSSEFTGLRLRDHAAAGSLGLGRRANLEDRHLNPIPASRVNQLVAGHRCACR